jgi:hypothetical protein
MISLDDARNMRQILEVGKILLLYQVVLEIPLSWLQDVVRAKRSQHVPVVLTKRETQQSSRGRATGSSRARPPPRSARQWPAAAR